MSSSLPNKKALAEAAQGPSWVRSMSQVQALGVGRAVRTMYGRWFDFQLERHRRQQDAPATAAFRSGRPSLTAAQDHVVRDLMERGVAHASLTSLVEPSWWETLRTQADSWLQSPEVQAAERAYQTAQARRWKDYLVRMFGRGAPIAFDAPWIQFAIQPAVLDVVNTYLGMFSKVLYVDVWDTVPLRHDGPDMGSQRWHRDPEDAKLVKVFLYFSDVDSESGAMEYVPYSRRGERYGNLWPQEFPKGSVPPLDEFDRLVPQAAREICAYPAGTLLFVDTSGFHRGGRAVAARRVTATWTFTRQSSVWPAAFELIGAPPELPPAHRFALLR
jgi:hypothetical protein